MLKRKKKVFNSSLCFVCFASDVMVGMGFTRDEIRDSLASKKYNEVTATYLLLGRKSEVSTKNMLEYLLEIGNI